MKKKIYYWASDNKENSGEGILALNFLKLLKLKYKNYLFININKYKYKNNFIYNYLFPFFGVFKLWKHHINNEKICYINYLPIWNFLLLILLPKKTILGPITGTNDKNHLIYVILKYLGIFILKVQKKKILFSHSQFKKYFFNNSKYFYNFILFNFYFKNKYYKKKFDFIFYFKKNRNKGNDFLIKIFSEISKKYKVAVIGDKLHLLKKQNVYKFINLKRSEALKVISQSKYAIVSKENNLSFFAIDCVSHGLHIFYNKNLKLNNSIKTNMYTGIDFNDLEYSIKKIDSLIGNKKKKYFFKAYTKNFLNYLN